MVGGQCHESLWRLNPIWKRRKKMFRVNEELWRWCLPPIFPHLKFFTTKRTNNKSVRVYPSFIMFCDRLIASSKNYVALLSRPTPNVQRLTYLMSFLFRCKPFVSVAQWHSITSFIVTGSSERLHLDAFTFHHRQLKGGNWKKQSSPILTAFCKRNQRGNALFISNTQLHQAQIDCRIHTSIHVSKQESQPVRCCMV